MLRDWMSMKPVKQGECGLKYLGFPLVVGKERILGELQSFGEG